MKIESSSTVKTHRIQTIKWNYTINIKHTFSVINIDFQLQVHLCQQAKKCIFKLGQQRKYVIIYETKFYWYIRHSQRNLFIHSCLCTSLQQLKHYFVELILQLFIENAFDLSDCRDSPSKGRCTPTYVMQKIQQEQQLRLVLEHHLFSILYIKFKQIFLWITVNTNHMQ